MIIGVPREIKIHEYRVSLTPSSVKELVRAGHRVVVEQNAGSHIGFTDEMYKYAGAQIIQTAQQIFDQAEMIVKVKEPQESEYRLLKEDQILFTYLHLAAEKPLTDALITSKSVAIAYETVTNSLGQLPLLMPMSEVAGRMSIQVGARCLEKYYGGSGILLGGVPGVARGNVVIIGGGIVGSAAAKMAMGMEANVTVIDRSIIRLNELDILYGNKISTLYSTKENIERSLIEADLVIGSVLVAGAAAPKLVTKEMISNMKPGSAIVDVAIDQGGCFETSRPTTHADPTYIVDNVVHYCVTNIPGAVSRTSAVALNNSTIPFVTQLANKGYKRAMKENEHLKNGLNVYRGQMTHKDIADQYSLRYISADEALGL